MMHKVEVDSTVAAINAEEVPSFTCLGSLPLSAAALIQCAPVAVRALSSFLAGCCPLRRLRPRRLPYSRTHGRRFVFGDQVALEQWKSGNGKHNVRLVVSLALQCPRFLPGVSPLPGSFPGPTCALVLVCLRFLRSFPWNGWSSCSAFPVSRLSRLADGFAQGPGAAAAGKHLALFARDNAERTAKIWCVSVVGPARSVA